MTLTRLRHAVRALVRRPLFTCTALLALALGIGADTAIISVVDAVLLKPLAYADPDRLVVVLHGGSNPVAPANYLDWRREARSFSRAGAAEAWGPNVTGDGEPEKLDALHVTADVFPLLGVRPLLGRAFRAGEDEPGNDREVVLGYALWQRRFGGARDVLGKSITLDGEAYTVIGVMPRDFHFAPFWQTRAELWAPLALAPRASSRGGQSLRVFARLAPGVSLAAARAEVASITARLEAQFPGTNRDVAVVPLKEKVVGDVRPMLLVLLGAVALVLLMACANVAHMLLARGAARHAEMAVRTALGATRTQLVRQLLAESVLLAAGGGALGLALGTLGVRSLVALAPRDLPRLDGVGLDARVVLVAVALTLLTGVACGLVPALRTAADGAAETLRDGARGSTEGARQHRTRRALIASEFALAVVLLVGAGLMLRTMAAVQSVNPGLDPRGVLTAVVSVRGSAENDPARRATFFPGLAARVAAIPGVRAAALINHVPIAGDVWGTSIAAEGAPVAPSGSSNADRPHATYRVVTPGYFRAMGVALRAGRDVAADDREDAPNVVVINEALARRLWQNASPLGRRLTLDDPASGRAIWRTVVGVVADVVQHDWTAPPTEEVYVPFLQSAHAMEPGGVLPASMSIVVRARDTEHPAAIAPALREAVWSIDRNLPLSEVRTMPEIVAGATARTRFVLLLLASFAVVAATLAAVGLYGVTSYMVSRRTREIGVRIALGAAPSSVARLVVGEVLALVGVGVAFGALGAVGLSRFMMRLLFGVRALDPLTFVGVVVLLGVVAIVAAYAPTRRAVTIEPLGALRDT